MNLNLLPNPKKITPGTGTFTLPATGYISLAASNPSDLLFSAQRLQGSIQSNLNRTLEINGGSFPAAVTLSLVASQDFSLSNEGYRLAIETDGIQIMGGSTAGVFYGICTLIQLIETQGATLPCLTIEDHPDFPNRGVMLDISRDKVPTMQTLYELIDMLASWKINQVQLYTEHTFAYRNHRVVWEKASPITAQEILELDAFCKQRFIDLVPNQNSFGHWHRWFKHAPYKDLAETEGEVTSPWGTVHPPFSLSPAAPGATDLLKELFAELLPNFSSQYFNVGCDETFDLGMGKSKSLVDEKGKGRVYLDFLLKIHALVKENGRTMQFWGDIINQYPDLVPEIPDDVIALEWGYEADHDFPNKSKLFAQSGVPFYVCPGTSSWTCIAGRTDNCLGNIRNAVENGLKNGAIGVLNTDWGDLGHWQPLPVSYLGFAYGAALSWSYEDNVNIDIAAALDSFAFRDEAGVMGKLAYELGNAYQKPGVVPHNGSVLFWMLQAGLESVQRRFENTPGIANEILNDEERFSTNLKETILYIDEVMANLNNARMSGKDAALIKDEFSNAARMLKHGAKIGLLQLDDPSVDKGAMKADLDGIEAAYWENWLARNRPGGLQDSVARFDKAGQLVNE